MKRSAGCTVTHLTLSGSHDSRVTTHDSRLTPTHDSRVNKESHPDVSETSSRREDEHSTDSSSRAVGLSPVELPTPHSPLAHSPLGTPPTGAFCAAPWESSRASVLLSAKGSDEAAAMMQQGST